MKLLIFISSVLLLITLFSFVNCEDAYFGFKTYGSHNDFIIKLTDDAKIKKARDILSGKETEHVHVVGKIVKRPSSYNPSYSFHLDSASIDFFNVAIEVCDATLPYVEEHLDEACGAFLPGCYFCPWSSQLTREIKLI